MKLVRGIAGFLVVSVAATGLGQRTYFGFDKNDYPGDDLLPALHRTFAYTGYWLNNPPGMSNNPWAGKRGVIRAAGFGFLVLFNGRLDAQLKGQDAAGLGREDASAAIAAAKQEGFPAGAIIFLDQEEGGSLLPEQAAYIGAWIAAVRHSRYKPGVYCSGIAVPSGARLISTAQDIGNAFRRQSFGCGTTGAPRLRAVLYRRNWIWQRTGSETRWSGNMRSLRVGLKILLVASQPMRPMNDVMRRSYCSRNALISTLTQAVRLIRPTDDNGRFVLVGFQDFRLLRS